MDRSDIMKRFALILLCCGLVGLPFICRAETLDEILEKNAQALGGREALEKLQNFTKEGKIVIKPGAPNAAALEGITKAFFKAPDKAYMATTIGAVTQIKATNGKVYWESETNAPLAGARI